MARSIGFSSATKTVGTSAETLIFAQNDLPPSVPRSSIVAFLVELTGGTAVDYSMIQRIRVKSGGSTIYDLTGPASTLSPGQHESFQERFGRGRPTIGATELYFSIWLNLLDEEQEDKADLCAMPLNRLPQLEIQHDGSPSAAGSIRVGWVLSNVIPRFSSMTIGQPMNLGASVTNGKVDIAEPGLIRGFGFNNRSTNGPSRHKLTLDGVVRAEGTPALIRSSQEIESDLTNVDPLWTKLVGMSTGGGRARAPRAVDTGSATDSGDEFAYWALRPQG